MTSRIQSRGDAASPPPPAGPGDGAPPESQDGGTDPATDIIDACAYDPAQAEEALAAGEPPTRAG